MYRLRLRAGFSNPHEVEADSLRDASEFAQAFIYGYDLTMHNFESALYDAESGELVGHVSYNGKVWPGKPSDWHPGMEPLYEKLPYCANNRADYELFEHPRVGQTADGEERRVVGRVGVLDCPDEDTFWTLVDNLREA